MSELVVSARYSTDFNEISGGCAYALVGGPGGSSTLPTIGDLVELFDADGNTCRARVDHVDENGLVRAKPDWMSWMLLDLALPRGLLCRTGTPRRRRKWKGNLRNCDLP